MPPRLLGPARGAEKPAWLSGLTAAPIFAALEVLDNSDRQTQGDSAEAVLARRALAACP